MSNTGSVGNFGKVSNPGLATTGTGGGMNTAPRNQITANQITDMLRQAQAFQGQGRFNDAINLCEQILESGFERADARYFLGWLYQEQQRWDEAIHQFQILLSDPDYALSCYYALGQCHRARGDLRAATMHFDEAVDRVNLDALTVEESDQLVQLCQEAAEAHRQLGEQEQALTVYNALLGFLRSRGWTDKISQVESMLRQAQSAPVPAPPAAASPNLTRVLPPEQTAPPVTQQAYQTPQSPPSMAGSPNGYSGQPSANSTGDLPDWLTGILNDGDKTQIVGKPASPLTVKDEPSLSERPTTEHRFVSASDNVEVTSTSWLTDAPKPTPPNDTPTMAPLSVASQVALPPPVVAVPEAQVVIPSPSLPVPPMPPTPPQVVAEVAKPGIEDLLSQMAGPVTTDEELMHVAEAVVASTATLPENIRLQVARSMQDIQKYINHGLLTPATEECLRVIDMAPQYLDVHQVLCEIYIRQGKVEQAITKYGILVDTYIVNGRTDDAIATYRRILQLDPNNLTCRLRLINLLSAHGNKEDLLRERTLAAESYLRLGYMDRALTELEQALQESPTNVSTRLNYALALQKLGRSQRAVAEYQRVLQIDPGNLTALVRWHIAMITSSGTARATMLEVLARIRWQLRGEGQKHYDPVVRDYNQASDLHPNNADVHYGLGQIYHQAGQFDSAIDAYTLAMRDSAVAVLAHVSAAHCFLSQGRPEGAIEQLETALQIIRRGTVSMDPGIWASRPREDGESHQAPEVEISMLLAKAYERTGRREQMEAILRQVKQTKTGQNEVASTLAEVSAHKGDIPSMLQEFMDLVHHHRNARQVDNALTVLNEMIRLAPQDPRAHEELADIYISRGLLDEGIAELRLLADIYLREKQLEQAGSAIQRIGTIYAETGDNAEALTHLRRAVELNSSDMSLLREVVGFCCRIGSKQDASQYQTIIARHYFDTQQVKESVAALQQLITLDRCNYDAYDMLGRTYQSVGEYEQASRVYKNLAKVNPDNSLARERLAVLQELRTR